MASNDQSKNFDKFIYFGDNVNYIGDRVNFDRAIKVLEREISYLNYEYKLECAQAQRDGSDVNHTRYERNIAELKAAIEKLQQD
jgi:hypothetical protein